MSVIDLFTHSLAHSPTHARTNSLTLYQSLSLAHSLCAHSLTPSVTYSLTTFSLRGRSGGAMVLGKLPVPGRPTILNTVGQGPIALVVGAGGGGLDIFTLLYPFSSFSLSLGDGSI